MFAKVVEELKIYQIATKLRNDLYKEVNRPDSWKIKDIDQIKRSSSSVAANIAEGFGCRFYPKKFIYYLNIALGSSDETQNHADALYEEKVFSKKRANDFKKNYKDLSIRIINLTNSIRKKNNLK